MRFTLSFFLIFLLFSSCSNKIEFPEKLTNRIPAENLILPDHQDYLDFRKLSAKDDFTGLQKYVSGFKQKDQDFNLSEFEEQWNIFSGKNDPAKLNANELEEWAGVTGLLFELTGNEKYASELEQISQRSGSSLKEMLAPFILTKNVDHIHVNLFQPVEINFEHSLGGNVTVRLETDFPDSGQIRLYFGMTEQRYIELFVRIPQWAEGAKVTVKNVKYLASPGTYCKIAKKWKEGDVVEIEFPDDRIPAYRGY